MEVDICPQTSLQLQDLMTFLNLENIKYTLRGPVSVWGPMINPPIGGWSLFQLTLARGGVTPRSFMIYYSKFTPNVCWNINGASQKDTLDWFELGWIYFYWESEAAVCLQAGWRTDCIYKTQLRGPLH